VRGVRERGGRRGRLVGGRGRGAFWMGREEGGSLGSERLGEAWGMGSQVP
jgi:hypothetical protein